MPNRPLDDPSWAHPRVRDFDLMPVVHLEDGLPASQIRLSEDRFMRGIVAILDHYDAGCFVGEALVLSPDSG